MTEPPLTDQTQAGLAYIDDARRRRKHHSPPADPPATVEHHQPEPDDQDSLGYATNLAAAVKRPPPQTPAPNADEILAQHEAAIITVDEAAPTASPDAGPADEILRALEGHHQRAEPHQRHHPPRGSADLDAHQPRRPRAKPAKSPKPARARRTLKAPRPSRRLVAASALAAALVAIALAVNGAGGTTPAHSADHQTARANTTLSANAAATLAAGDYPIHGKLGATHYQSVSAAHTARRAHRPARHKPVPQHHPATGASGSSSNTPVITASSSSANNTPQQTYSSTPAASDSGGNSSSSQTSGSSSGSSAPAPAGPAGAGGTVGGNCNPKCS